MGRWRRELRRLISQYRRRQSDGVVARKRTPSADHLEDDHAERVEIGAAVDVAREILFGRGVAGRADQAHADSAWHAHRHVRARRHEPRDAEVQHLRAAVGAQHHVRRLQVAMNHALRVRGRQRIRQLPRHFHRLGHRQRAALQPRRQRVALRRTRTRR